MYAFINIASMLIRGFLLPNPFENLIGNKVGADLFNIFVGGAILHFLAFFMTGCWYTKGANKPVGGSLSYLICYTAITGLFILLSSYIKNLWLCLGVFVGIYIAACFILSKFKTTYVKF